MQKYFIFQTLVLFLFFSDVLAQQKKTETVVERFLRYVKIDTQSSEDSAGTPTTQKQFNLARLLAQELKELGLSNARVDSFCFVYATLPSNLPPALSAKVPAIGLLAHMDTSPEVSGNNVNPVIHRNYKGGDIVLPNDPTQIISVEKNKNLLENIGNDIITADGTTLLGADDKSGIAEIMTALQTLANDPSIKHGTLCIAFTPDEETGTGIDKFDVKNFGAKYAYTIDGGELGEISDETWSADAAVVTIKGKSMHPGDAKGKMVNSAYAASYFLLNVPENMKPETTDKRDGFMHPYNGALGVEESKLKFILRDFELSGLDKQRAILESLAKETMSKYAGVTVDITFSKEYRNMKLKLNDVPFVTEYALSACKRAGVVPKPLPVRGGTDGSNLTDMGLPCPNLFTGGENFHSKLEWIPVQAMNKTVETILHLVRIWVEKNS